MKQESFRQFVGRQWEQTRKGGWPAFEYKLRVYLSRRRLKYAIVFILTIPIFIIPFILIRLIRPWFLIRVGRLESSGIGHFSLPVEIYLGEVDSGIHDPGQKYVDIWYLDPKVCNTVLKEKWSCFFKIWPRQIVQSIDNLNRIIPGGKIHKVPYRYLRDRSTPWQNVDIHNVLDKTTSHLVFSADEEAVGMLALQKMGIGENDSIICFMVRDGAYHNETVQDNHRNASVNLLVPAMEMVTKLGYKAVRMGAKVRETLRTSNPSIVDYATNGMRTELLDLFLVGRSRFMVSNGTGIDALALTFRRPLVYLNLAQFGFVDEMNKSVIFTPKHYWSTTEKRMLTFPEIFKLGAHMFTLQWQYKVAGVESVDNSPDEINAVVSEMEQRVSGTWVSYPEDEILQDRFRSIWPLRRNSRPLQARIGAEFLRQHPELLG
jgi:putative glycosyltransferase (TIGR04372 family)